MDKQWFPAAGILLAALLAGSASTLALPSTHEDLKQFPSAPGTSAQQSPRIPLDFLTETVGHINSVERGLEALERRAGALSTEAVGGQESPSMPGLLGSTRPLLRVIPGPIPSALTISAAHVTIDSQPVSSGADPVKKNVASGTLETITMSSPQPSPTRGSKQKFSKVSRSLGLLWNTSSPTAWRDGHSRLEASSGRSRPDLTSESFPVASGSSENTVALGTGPGAHGASVWLLFSATSPSHPSSPDSPPSSSALLLPSSSTLAPVSSATTGARDPPKPSVSVTAPSATDSSIKTSNLTPLMALRPSHPGPSVSTTPICLPTLSLQHFSKPPSVPHSSSFTEVSRDADASQSSALPHPGQDVTLQDLSSSTPGPSHVTHSVTFRINSKCLTTAVWNLVALECPLLNKLICYQLQLIYHETFSSFKNVSALLFWPGSTEVKASLVFGQPDPAALEVLWTLYRKVKASRWLLGYLSLADSSLSADGHNMTDLKTLETINISFTLMRPFLPQLLLPGSQPFILLEKQILQLVSNVNEWVSIYMEYKFKSSIPTHVKGLASYLAHHITDPTLQKSSMVANGEKAELALYETWLLILGHPFTKAMENKTRSESQELRGRLTKWLTSALQPLQNFAQVVVEGFQQEPPTAKVQAAFFGAAPAQAIIQDCMHQALSFLQETEGLQLEMLLPALGIPSSEASRGSSHGFPPNLQLITSLLVLVALGAAPHFTEKQISYLS